MLISLKGQALIKFNYLKHVDFTKLASREAIEKTIKSLKANGIDAMVVETGQAAKAKVLELLPPGAEVMDMTSVTLSTIGLDQEIQTSGKFKSIRRQLMGLDRKSQGLEMNKLGAAPQYAVGSVHAATEDGQVMIASNTGSQLPAYAYGAAKVIWVVGAQKIVKDLDLAYRRIFEYSLVLESERAQKAYGAPGSSVNKVLLIKKEVQAGRITMIIVNQVLGF